MCPIWSSNWWDSTCFMALITEIRSPAGESTVLNCNGDFNLYCHWDSSSVIQALMLWNIFPRYENYLISALALENPAEKCNKSRNIAPCWRTPGGSFLYRAATTPAHIPTWILRRRADGYTRPWTLRTKPHHKPSLIIHHLQLQSENSCIKERSLLRSYYSNKILFLWKGNQVEGWDVSHDNS